VRYDDSEVKVDRTSKKRAEAIERLYELQEEYAM
jgi:hypothetical protein